MKSRNRIILLTVLAVILIVVFDSLYVVPQTQQAIVIQFGEPKRVS